MYIHIDMLYKLYTQYCEPVAVPCAPASSSSDLLERLARHRQPPPMGTIPRIQIRKGSLKQGFYSPFFW